MRTSSKLALWAVIVTYIILWIGGVVSTALWDSEPEGTEWAAPAFLYLAMLLVVARVSGSARLILFVVGVFGFFAEVLGESTGFPFGDYAYTDKLGPAVFDVPLALACAWIVVTVFTVNLLQRLGLRRKWWPLAGPVTMVLVDLLLEPIATGPMNAWTWNADGAYYGVPAMNFVGWFLVSLPIFSLLALAGYRDRGGFFVAASVIAFFVAISAITLLWWPVTVAAGLVSLLIMRRAMPQRLRFLSSRSAEVTRT